MSTMDRRHLIGGLAVGTAAWAEKVGNASALGASLSPSRRGHMDESPVGGSAS
jgi:hypothetical protein